MQSPSLRDLNLSSEELKEIAELLALKSGIKDYASMPEDRLLSAIISSKPAKKDKDKSKHKFSKSKRNEIRRKLYEIKSKTNLFTLGTKKTEKMN